MELKLFNDLEMNSDRFKMKAIKAVIYFILGISLSHIHTLALNVFHFVPSVLPFC